MPATGHLPRTLGPYRLQDRLGEGGMGVVHLAHDPEGRPVAVKVLHPAGAEGPNARRRLAREVETMRRVRSPYVAEVLDADVAGEYPYIVTRYVSGPTLDEMVRSRGPLSGLGLRRLADGDRRGAGRDPRGGRGPPRPQAGQRDAHRRPADRDRLRHRADRRRHPADPDRPGHGHAGLPGPRGDRGPAEQSRLGHPLLGLDDDVRGHRPPAVRRRLLRDDLLPHRLRPRRPDRRPRPARPADLRRAGQGSLAPAVGHLAQRPGQHARHVGRRAGRGRQLRPDRHLRRVAAARAAGPAAHVHAVRRAGRCRCRSRARRTRGAPGPKQAARDVADLLPPVDYTPPPRPAQPPGSPARPRRYSGRRCPDQGPAEPRPSPAPATRSIPGTRRPRARRPGRTPRSDSPSWSPRSR